MRIRRDEGCCAALRQPPAVATWCFILVYNQQANNSTPVSYTHLDVYKRQLQCWHAVQAVVFCHAYSLNLMTTGTQMYQYYFSVHEKNF